MTIAQLTELIRSELEKLPVGATQREVTTRISDLLHSLEPTTVADQIIVERNADDPNRIDVFVSEELAKTLSRWQK